MVLQHCNTTIKLAPSQSNKDSERRGEAVGKALDTIAQFHLVLAMEWLPYAGVDARIPRYDSLEPGRFLE